MSTWPRALGGAPLQARLRAQPEDFFVDEDLGFSPDGSGEHVLLRVEKRGANTEWVAKAIARFAGVAPEAVGYAGLKDRHAVTRQSFSVPLSQRQELDWSTLVSDEFQVIQAQRHGRKLKRGALKRNRFRIQLREVQGDRAAAEAVLAQLRERGVPNYFGEQRFGRDGDNTARALAMFGGRRVQRHERSLLLSAARSALFNAVLAQRVAQGNWDQPLDGDVWMLDGSHSIFGPEALSEELQRRLAQGDIHTTGPLWGAGELRSNAACAALERGAVAAHAALAQGLEQAGLSQERRSLRLFAQELQLQWNDAGLCLEFALPAGCYATTVLRELAEFDAAGRVVAMQE